MLAGEASILSNEACPNAPEGRGGFRFRAQV